MPQTNSVKTQLLKRLRRTNMTVARQARLIDEKLLEKLTPDGELLAAVNPSAAAFKETLLQFEQRYNRLSLFFNEHETATQQFQSVTEEAAHQAHSLLQSPPAPGDSPDELKLQHFQRLHSTPEINSLETLPALAREARAIVDNGALEQSVIADYSKRVLWSIEQASIALESFRQEMVEELGMTVYRHQGMTVIAAPDSKATLLNTTQIRAVLDLPPKCPVLVVSDTLKQGELPIFQASPQLSKGWSLDGGPLGAVIHQGEKPCITFPNTDDTGFLDNLFNNKSIENKRHPLMQLAQFWSTQQRPTDTVVLSASAPDLSALSAIHNTAGVSQENRISQQLPVHIQLSGEQRWFIDHNGARSLVTLDAIDTKQPVTIYPEATSECGLLFSADTQQRLRNGPVTLRINQYTPTQWQTTRVCSDSELSQQQSVPFPDPTRTARKKAAQQHVQRQDQRGYLDKQYTQDELLTLVNNQGESSLAGLEKGLSDALEALQADTLVSISVSHTQQYEPTPYYISLTLYSQTQKGPNVRRVACCIHDPNTPYPTDTQLDALGMSREIFAQHALTPEEAKQHINKPFKQFTNGRLAVSLTNAQHTLRHINHVSPELGAQLQKAPILDRQDLTKRHHLSSRADRGLTLKLHREGARPVTFYDTPGDRNGLRAQLKRDKGQWFSHDGSAVLQWQEGVAVLHDLQLGLRGEIGTPASLLRQFHSEQRAPNYHQNSGDMMALRQQHRLARLLDFAIGDLPEKKPAEPIELPKMPREQPALGVLRQYWPSIAIAIDQSVRFDLSIDDNLAHCSTMLDKINLDWDAPLAGGIGGRTGKTFLTELRQQSPALFAAVTAGKKLDLEKLFQGTAEQRIQAEQATLSLRDVVYAQIQQAFQQNPAQTAHFSMQRQGVDALLRMEPTTKEPPQSVLPVLSRTYGIEQQHLSRLYRAAYDARIHNSRSFHTFLPTVADIHPMGDHDISEHAALWSRFEQVIPSHQASAILSEHALRNAIKQAVDNIRLLTSPQETALSLPLLSDHGQQLVVSGAVEKMNTKTINRIIDPWLRKVHISNGLHNIFTRKGNAPDDLALANWTMLAEQIKSLHDNGKLHKMDKHLQQQGIASLRLAPHDNTLQSMSEQLLLIGHGLEASQLEFNKKLSPNILNHIKSEIRTIAQHLPGEHVFDYNLVSQLLETASQQYQCYQSLQRALHADHQRILPNDDSIVRKRHYQQQAELWSIPTKRMTRGDFLHHWLTSSKDIELPERTLSELKEAANNDLSKLPSEPLARKLVQHTRDLLRTPLKLPHNGLISDVLNEFNVTANTPIDTLLDDTRYQSLREGLRRLPSDDDHPKEPSITPAP